MAFWKMIDGLADALLDTIENNAILEYATRFGMSEAEFIRARDDARAKKEAKRAGKARGKPARE